jgi:Raf kinase inhibitor-like YbhB/YbcL family protein
MFYSILFLIVGALYQPNVYQPNGGPDTTLTLKSPAFEKGQTIPVQYTCDGKDVSPEVSWANVPAGTKSFALIIDDPDAGSNPWVHWVIFNIPRNQRMLEKDVPNKKELKSGALQGVNDFKNIGFGGPCPPKGPAHRYVMKFYALKSRLDLKAGVTKAQVIKAMKGHIIGKAVLKAKYKRR